MLRSIAWYQMLNNANAFIFLRSLLWRNIDNTTFWSWFWLSFTFFQTCKIFCFFFSMLSLNLSICTNKFIKKIIFVRFSSSSYRFLFRLFFWLMLWRFFLWCLIFSLLIWRYYTKFFCTNWLLSFFWSITSFLNSSLRSWS